MSKQTIRWVENHIYCDVCERDIVDVVGYGMIKMKELEKWRPILETLGIIKL